LIYLVSFAFIFPEPSLEEWTGIDKDVPMGRLLQLICLFIDPGNIVEVPPYLRSSILEITDINNPQNKINPSTTTNRENQRR
jgi:hypothetical protein